MTPWLWAYRRQVQAAIQGRFDTHQNNDTQSAAYQAAIGGVLELMDALGTTPSPYGRMLIDDTLGWRCWWS